MNEIIRSGLMKEGSLSARIYFLLLNKPLTQSEISKLIYSGKVQLANIKKNIEDLERGGFIKNIGRVVGIGKNYNQIYYTATPKPILEFIKKQVKFRSKTSKSKNKGEINREEIKFLNIFLTSDWFRKFYSQEYLNLDLECEGKLNNRSCSCPIRFFARLLEEIFVINEDLGNYNLTFNKENVRINSFDKFILYNKSKITVNNRLKIKKIVKIAKKVLGNYPNTNKIIDFYFRDYGVLFLPYTLSKKLSTLGRIPLTVSNAFNIALEEN